MTVLEMQQYFETLLQTTSPIFNDADKPDTDTILRFLNVAQIEFINKKYLSAPTFAERVRTLSESIGDFDTLVSYKTLNAGIATTGTFPQNSKLYALTGDEWHFLGASGLITRITLLPTSNTAIDFEAINISDLDKYTTTYINIPIILVPGCTLLSDTPGGGSSTNNILVMYDKYTTLPSTIKLTYLKEPSDLIIGGNCELSSYLHEDLVKLAVQMFEEAKYKLVSKKGDK